MQLVKLLRQAFKAGNLLALWIIAVQPAFGVLLTREPYLQQLTPNSATIMWQTDLTSAENSQVQYGTSLGNLNQSSTSTAIDYPSNPNVKNHAVTITGLTANTKYFYNIGTVGVVEGGGTAEHFFVTAPPVGSTTSFRAWVLGDSGNGSVDQEAVRNAMLAETGSSPPDMILHAGDIAYEDGKDTEFTDRHFAVYKDILRHTPVWPTIGNHESQLDSGPYYEAHVVPTAGEVGGIPSGTEAYYSFDYANVHFIVLDSMDNFQNQAMRDWLAQDLASTLQDWVIAYWHHPPYSKGTHNSDSANDSGGRLIAMREDILPILEAGGVDVVIAGHSHIYERSYLIDGAFGYGSDPTFVTPDIGTLLNDGHILDIGDGDPAGDGAYVKNSETQSEGTVYVVAGHGGHSVGGTGGHPVMAYDEVAFGSVIMDVANDTVTLRNINASGVITDTVRIVKGEPPPPVTGFTAYNDLAWGSGQLASNITTYTSPTGGSGLDSQGELIDFDSGLATGVNLTVTGGDFDGDHHAGLGANPAADTDAHAVFNGKLNGRGQISYISQSSSSLVLSFTGLNASKNYDLVFYAHRDKYVWDRASLVTLSGQDAFTNNSSSANDNPSEPGGVLFSGASDPSTRLPADNDNGYVARFDNIDPGSDGEIVLTISFDGNTASQYKGKYGSALMLRENDGGSPGNQAPTVDAGPDQTITLPSNAALDGSVDDDGQPSGNLTTTWSQVSGPGTVDFADASAVDTTASFSTAGSYVLRLTADDGQLQTTDDISVTVDPAPPGNQAPTVDAGPDQTITLPSNVALDGSVDDDGQPSGNLTTTWSQVSGPGSVNFGNASAVDTTASFSTAGSYVLRLTADDGQLQTTDDISVTVDPAPPGNQAPTVDAGPDQTITLPSNAALNGSVDDDGQPSGNLTTTWSQVSGPGTVDFADASAVDTTASFSTAGSYVLRLTADDGQLQTTDDISVTVNSGSSTNFTAYNDLAWGSGQLASNITTYTSPTGGSGLDSQGELIDFDSGLATGVNLTVTGGDFDGDHHAGLGANPAADTDAHAVFNGKLNGRGQISYISQSSSSLVLSFTGLNASKNYDLVFYAHRDKYVWDRASLVTLSGQDAFTNNSSSANDNPSEPGGVLFSGASDPSTRLPADNDNGYVARFDNVDPGSDGQILLTISFDGNTASQYKGKYGSALMLRENDGGSPGNQAPTVDAGPDQTITLPSNAALNGSVDDDGQPSGNLTTTWSQVSGPGTVDFADASAVDTTASFSTAGSYVLRLTADDGQLQTTDDISVTVDPAPPGNQAPTVDAGPDQTITLPSNVALDGSVDDDGQPSGNLTTTWSQVSGPGSVNFGNASAVDTTASFSTAGSYVLRLTADDGQLQTTDDISVTVDPAPPGNQAPTVDAGPDQTITLPSNAALNGSVDDDGQPSGNLTTTWSQVSGPGTVDFADASAVDTTASFSTAGSYVLRLTADDGQLQTTDDISVTVNSGSSTNFTAYNDLAWGSGQLASNITTYTSPTGGSGLDSQGELIDFDSGLATGVNLTVTGGDFDGDHHAGLGANPAAGTDAHAVFNGKLNGRGQISYISQSSSSLVLSFTGLNASKNYDLVFYAHRDKYVWDRASLVTLSGQDAFTNNSSSANDNPSEPGGVLFSGASDPSTRLPADNDNGYVARFDNIDPGSDGEIVLTISFDGNTASQYKGKYGSALMLRENDGGSPGNQAPTVDAGPDQTITWPSAATLNGAVSDDGQPSGTLTTNWSQVSGPATGTATFGDASAAQSTATFDADGTYVLRLTADDGQLQTIDDVTIIVNPQAPGNQAPTVNAGPDQTITLPSAATLNGAVSDDGQPSGTLTTNWSQVSGPATGTATFGDASAAQTTATFDADGTYVLRLTADDGQLQTIDDVTIIVNPQAPGNQAPTVNAGPDQTITLPSAATLNGAVSDDGQPSGTLTTNWSQVSGPATGTATFGDASAAQTTATFDADGTYVLRLTADDGQLQTTDDVTITVNAGGTSTNFTAYNDLAWGSGQLASNITTYTSPTGGSGLDSQGELIDFDSGLATGVNLTVTGGDFDGDHHAGLGANPAAGTDAHAVFNGKLNGLGHISYVIQSGSSLVLTFTGLNASKTYDLVFYAHRNKYAWDRASLVTLSGQDSFTNNSSTASDNPSETGGVLFTGPSDPSTRLPADNDNGYVARFDNVDPGSDGQILLTISFDGNTANQYKGKYASALMLREL